MSTAQPATSIFGSQPLLPRGPHGLTREQVAASQRTRLLASMTELVAERGYAKATITDTARGAGVSPNVFYAHFADKEECFLAAYDAFVEALLMRMTAEVDPDSEWTEFLTSTLDAYLGTLEAEPAVARAFLLEIEAAGPRTRERRRQAYGAMAALIRQRHEQMRRSDPSLGPLPERAYLAFVHGVRGLVCDALESRPPRRLTNIAPDVLRWISATIAGARADAGTTSVPTVGRSG